MSNKPRVFLRLLLAFTFIAFCARAASATMIKYHQVQMDSSHHPVAEFTSIKSSNQASNPYPYTERVLYKDESGRLLVIRRSYPTPTSSATTYTCPATGETLELDVTLQYSVTVKFAGHSLIIRGADVDRGATALPPAIAAQVTTVLQGLSAACRNTLHRMVEIGASYSIEFSVDAGELGGTMFPDIPSTSPNDESLLAPYQDMMKPFDPNQTPPNAFEQQFGSAYYQ